MIKGKTISEWIKILSAKAPAVVILVAAFLGALFLGGRGWKDILRLVLVLGVGVIIGHLYW